MVPKMDSKDLGQLVLFPNTVIIVTPKPFHKMSIFLEALRKIAKGLEKSADGDKLALIELSAADRDKPG